MAEIEHDENETEFVEALILLISENLLVRSIQLFHTNEYCVTHNA